MIKGELIPLIENSHPGMSDAYFNLLYSIYSLPNIIFPIIAGIMIDKIGNTFGTRFIYHRI